MNDVMTPEEYQMLLELGAFNGDLDDQIKQQREQAKMLRANGQAPEGGMVGRVYVGPSWTQYAGAGMNQAGAKYRDEKAGALSTSKNANTQKQNEMIMRALLKGQQGQTQPMLPSQMPQQPPIMTTFDEADYGNG